ncbi:MAG TPA: superoxide dismutase family protein [Pseudonocardia sp.]|jgi:Cu-Zn family superoxide dismutase
MQRHRRYLTGLGALCLVFAAAACGGSKPSVPTAVPSAQTAPPSTTVDVTFGTDPTAFTYDKTQVPEGAHVQVVENVVNNTTKVTLTVQGLQPNRTYGAHVHKMPCGPTGEAAGTHFQHSPDPVKPSVDPAFANPTNEIWLDLTTDAKGDATSSSTVPWTFTSPRAGSVVIHAEKTKTARGKAGTAGARLACVSVGF